MENEDLTQATAVALLEAKKVVDGPQKINVQSETYTGESISAPELPSANSPYERVDVGETTQLRITGDMLHNEIMAKDTWFSHPLELALPTDEGELKRQHVKDVVMSALDFGTLSFAQQNLRRAYNMSKASEYEASVLTTPIPEASFKAMPEYREGMKWYEGVTIGELRVNAEMRDERKTRELMLLNSPSYGMGATSVAMEFATQMLDPLNYIPIFGTSAMIGKTALRTVGRAGALTAVEAAAQVGGMLAIQNMVHSEQGDPMTPQEVMGGLAMAMGLGFGIRGALTGIKLGPELREQMFKTFVHKGDKFAESGRFEGNPVELESLKVTAEDFAQQARIAKEMMPENAKAYAEMMQERMSAYEGSGGHWTDADKSLFYDAYMRAAEPEKILDTVMEHLRTPEERAAFKEMYTTVKPMDFSPPKDGFKAHAEKIYKDFTSTVKSNVENIREKLSKSKETEAMLEAQHGEKVPGEKTVVDVAREKAASMGKMITEITRRCF